MFKILTLLFFFLNIILITPINANNKEKIIKKLQSIENLNFEFEQNINGRIEKGNCTINYPKKIFCKYSKINNKILVSNGKSIVIKTIASFYRYPLKKTPLNFILDKDGVHGLGLSFKENEYVFINFSKTNQNYMQLLKQLFENPTVIKISYKIKPQLKILKGFDISTI